MSYQFPTVHFVKQLSDGIVRLHHSSRGWVGKHTDFFHLTPQTAKELVQILTTWITQAESHCLLQSDNEVYSQNITG